MLTGKVVGLAEDTRATSRRASSAGRSRRRAGDPSGGAPGDAHHGPPVRDGPHHRGGAEALAQGRERRLPLQLRHARRGGADPAGRARYLEAYRARSSRSAAAGPYPDVFAAPSISVKLSALHPRYEHGKRARVHAELTPRVLELAQLARAQGIGFTIDAEEADRLELSPGRDRRVYATRRWTAGRATAWPCRPTRSARRGDRLASPTWPASTAAGCRCGWSRAPTGTPRSSAPRSTARPATRCSPASPTPTSATSPARAACSRHRRALPDVRHPQRAHHRRDPPHGAGRSRALAARECRRRVGKPLTPTPPQRASSSRSCTAWASDL
jgi:hypothetical protein